MNKKNIMYLFIVGLLIVNSPVNAMELTPDFLLTQDISTRASRIIASSSSYLDKSKCSYSLSFLSTTTGSGFVTIQKKLSNGSWNDVSSVEIGFINRISFSDSIYYLSLYSGTYRIEYKLTVGSITETIYSGEKTL